MTFQTNSYNEYLIPPYASSDMPPRRRWWSRPIVTMPPTNGRKATCKETTVCCIPFCGAIFTIIAVMVYLFHFVDNVQCDAKFAIQSIAVSPSNTWHVDFLVKNPCPRFSIYYEGDETEVSLGTLSAAVLNTSHERKSPSHTAFSVDFVAEGNPNDVVSEQLDVKLRGTHKSYGENYDNAGHIDLFTNSVSVSNANANVSAADWTIGFVARSPVTGCEVSIHTLNSRLLRGSEVISKSSSSPSSGYFVTGNKTDVVFEKVVMPKVIGDVIWDARVEIMFAMNTDVRYLNGFLMAACPRIPVKFTTDQAGKVTGSLLGNVKRCDYIFQKHLA
ncbi:hypothetical protein ISN45_At05g020510 [Arabidopsis thaliana x Arabidopsis arenosa]|uniref:Transmembrane protein n=1 Tax=Arabidopsis thaliana x Arabidopsis arenosa TaxID=1240361 RepID=A0A8T2CUC9_9BRAS|nr:hypothetical protein ISN45_At05g020510 [Arabidopsis thaliana x Arabidopsis arenosa]